MNNFNDMCDVPWWDELVTDDEKDEYCQKHYGKSFSEWIKSLNSKLRYDTKEQKWIED